MLNYIFRLILSSCYLLTDQEKLGGFLGLDRLTNSNSNKLF